MFRSRHDRETDDPGLAVFHQLRGGILDLDPASVGMSRQPGGPAVWGGLMEFGKAGGTATVVSLADGTTSLYTSSGGGIIGGGEHADVAQATRAFLQTVEGSLDRFGADPDNAVPRPDHVMFRALTYSGILRVEERENALRQRDHPLFAVYRSGHEVITRLRLMEARQSL